MNKQNITIRELTKDDIPAVKAIIDSNQMFPSELIDDMAQSYFSQSTEELWFVLENDARQVIAVAYCAPERMTEGTWNLLLIAVLKPYQGAGMGAQLMAFVEKQLQCRSARVLLVETSGLPEYALTREFYPKCGYQQVAVIPEYYDKGDDKVVFWKSLAG